VEPAGSRQGPAARAPDAERKRAGGRRRAAEGGRHGRIPHRAGRRVYDIALEAIAHGDGRLDGASLRRFVAAYQEFAPLKLGELWAIPIMPRLALLENLRRVAARIAVGTAERNLAEAWADIAGRDAKSLILSTADIARSSPPMTSSFAAELARRLQGRSVALALPLTWMEQRLSELDLTIEQLVPPFDKSASNPGYIKGYVPGVRENGGQYTHAAIWAFAELGDRRRAWEIFAMINPVNHAKSAGAVATYKVEPYVMAADV
jgi:Glycosyl hydrolase 36 superfamily, catalytic domain